MYRQFKNYDRQMLADMARFISDPANEEYVHAFRILSKMEDTSVFLDSALLDEKIKAEEKAEYKREMLIRLAQQEHERREIAIDYEQNRIRGKGIVSKADDPIPDSFVDNKGRIHRVRRDVRHITYQNGVLCYYNVSPPTRVYHDTVSGNEYTDMEALWFIRCGSKLFTLSYGLIRTWVTEPVFKPVSLSREVAIFTRDGVQIFSRFVSVSPGLILTIGDWIGLVYKGQDVSVFDLGYLPRFIIVDYPILRVHAENAPGVTMEYDLKQLDRGRVSALSPLNDNVQLHILSFLI